MKEDFLGKEQNRMKERRLKKNSKKGENQGYKFSTLRKYLGHKGQNIEQTL